MEFLLIAVLLVQFTGPDGKQRIDINPAEVTSIREPRNGGDHLAPGTKCLIYLTNGNFITVKEDCDTVRQKVRGGATSSQAPCIYVCGEVRPR